MIKIERTIDEIARDLWYYNYSDMIDESLFIGDFKDGYNNGNIQIIITQDDISRKSIAWRIGYDFARDNMKRETLKDKLIAIIESVPEDTLREILNR